MQRFSRWSPITHFIRNYIRGRAVSQLQDSALDWDTCGYWIKTDNKRDERREKAKQTLIAQVIVSIKRCCSCVYGRSNEITNKTDDEVKCAKSDEWTRLTRPTHSYK